MTTTIKSGLEFIFSASNTNEKDVNVVSSWPLTLPDENVLALSYLSCPLSFKSLQDFVYKDLEMSMKAAILLFGFGKKQKAMEV